MAAVLVAALSAGRPAQAIATAAVDANGPELVTKKVSRRESTRECAGCALGRSALELAGEFRRTGGSPAHAWAWFTDLAHSVARPQAEVRRSNIFHNIRTPREFKSPPTSRLRFTDVKLRRIFALSVGI